MPGSSSWMAHAPQGVKGFDDDDDDCVLICEYDSAIPASGIIQAHLGTAREKAILSHTVWTAVYNI